MHNVFRHRKRGVFKQKLVKDVIINTNLIYIVYVELYIYLDVIHEQVEILITCSRNT